MDLDLDARELSIRTAVGTFLILDLDPALLDRAERARRTTVTMIFADLDEAIQTSLALGSELIAPPFPVPTGRGARLRHPDG